MEFIRSNYKKLIIYLALLLAGIVFILIPGFITNFVGIIFGLVIIAISIYKIVQYFMSQRMTPALASGWYLGEGVIGIIMGIILLLVPSSFLSTIVFFLGIYFVINGIIKIRTVTIFPVLNDFAWWVTFLGSIAIVVLGALIIFNPFKGTSTVIILFGVCLILSSLQQIGELYTNRFRM